MVDSRIKISNVVQNQFPDFVKEEYPLFSDFLKQYYNAIENQGSPLDILQNIDRYIKLDKLTNLVDSTTTTSDISYFDSTINVTSTNGFPNTYGLLKIGNEIITYTEKTDTSFVGCVRGFSGVTSYNNNNNPDQLVFSQSESEEHFLGSSVQNLSILFLKEFLSKIKSQLTPGFEGRSLYGELNENVFIKQSKDFYSSKGTDESFKILFRSLYGEEVQVIKPSDSLFIPSDAEYRITRDIVVQSISGNPLELINKTLFQDENDLANKAYGSINNVRKLQRDDQEYYILSLDYDYSKDISVSGSIFGTFLITPTTKVITEVSIGSSVIDVDSTVGFGTSGSLICTLPNGSDLNIKYNSKSYNQFYECSGIDQLIPNGQLIRHDSYAYGYSGISTENVVKVRITGVISDIDIQSDSFLHQNNEFITVKSLGATLNKNDTKSNNWIFNISTSYDVENATLLNPTNYSYRISTYDENIISVGDKVRLFFTDGSQKVGSVYSILSSDKKTFDIKGQGQINLEKLYKVQRLLSKASSTNYPEISIYSTDVQNVYVDNEDNPLEVYVASTSIPNYFEQKLNIKDRSVTFSGTFDGIDLQINSHGFYTGDSVVYIPENETNSLNILEGIYFIKKVDNNTLRLARSRANIQTNNFINISGTVTNSKLELADFSYQKLTSQKLVRKLTTPIKSFDENNNITGPGATGILVNGVEILNYKSKNSISYGSIESIDILSGGSGYDLINPPVLSITDPVGSGATGYCEVEGILERIDVIDGGFDYLSEPVITINGGSGFGAEVKANMVSIFHSVSFNASSQAGLVDLTNNTIAFSTYHKFRDAERVIYRTEGQPSISGLTTDSSYYVSVQDEYSVKLHINTSDASSGINTVEISSYGEGTHVFEAYSTKKIIGSINVENSGSGYKNRKIVTIPSGINVNNNTINAKDHRYNTGDIITYSSSGSPIGGMSVGSYYVTKVDDDNFRVSSVGIGSISKDFYYKTGQFVNFTNAGTGNHIFNYEPITVIVSGNIGISTLSGQNFNAQLQPVFRGEIKSVYLEDGGVSYGSSEIINYNRQPKFELKSGSGAEVITVVSNGSIQEVLIVNSGNNYNSIPDLLISGPTGSNGAILTPIIDSEGSLVDVKVINGGFGYSDGTTVTISSPGKDAELYSNATKWNINIVERLFQSDLITDDDGIIHSGLNDDYGLQYTHAYSPRKLRQSLLASKYINGQLTYLPDLRIVNNVEINSDAHSPIIGWAYDGNPIYGPYGYDTPSGGIIRSMISGYELSKSYENRPPLSIYPEGFFVNDYKFTGNGDLDEYNGRFCITPEFPNGVYAYFTTVSNGPVDSFGPFSKYKRPTFPYFIGEKYKSLPNKFNYDRYSNQDYINPSDEGWLRNTSPYNLRKLNSSYEYLFNPNKVKEQKSVVNNTERSRISRIGVGSGGNLYRVNDIISFDTTGSVGLYAYAKVSKVDGYEIASLESSEYIINEIEFSNSKASNRFIGYSTQPHNLKNLDIVSISGLSTNSIFTQNNFYTIGVSTNILRINQDVLDPNITGIITYFSVLGNLLDIKSNDIYTINSEKVKVLNVDYSSSRIRVVRGYGGSVGQSHTLSDYLYEDPRKFTFTANPLSQNNLHLNKVIYFNPQESIGLGTLSGVGIGTTIQFTNVGAGITQLFIPTKSIYLPGHDLNTGTELIYSSGSGSAISISTDGVTSEQLIYGQKLYVAKISNDLIGIATSKVGIGTNGNFIGIASDIVVDTLYFTGIGTGFDHSFKTNYNVVSGDVLKNTVTVSIASTHGLLVDDIVNVSVLSGITTTISIKYNDTLNKMVVNPFDFASLDVDTVKNTIRLANHGLSDGQKIIHTSASPSGGLSDNTEYYVILVDQDNIKLASTYYNSIQNPAIEIDLTSASSGTISPINPELNLYNNEIVRFDLSDPSLSYLKSSNLYPAFDFNIYYDSELKNIFTSTKNSGKFEVIKNGRIGIDTSAYLELKVNDFLPKNLYYALTPIVDDSLPVSKSSLIIDNEYIIKNNKITIIDSVYTGSHRVSGVNSTSFEFNLSTSPEKYSYSQENSTITYDTSSENVYGPIKEVTILNGGNYKTLPSITSIITEFGSGADLEIYTESIGRIKNIEIIDIGFDYPSDKTIRPIAKVPQVLRIDPLSSFESIGITSTGVNYIISPNLIVIDAITGKVDTDAILDYELGDKFVSIVQNSNGFNNVTPIILPINNSNGVGISTISYDSVSGDVTATLNVGFSTITDFPFNIGDRVIVENISVGVNSTGRGYNSEDYNYQLFTINSIDPNIGGIGATIGYNLSNYLNVSESPGGFDPINSFGRIIPEKHFPIFDVILKKNTFFTGESVKTSSNSGIIENYDLKNNYIVVSSQEDFEIGELIRGESSNSQGVIIKNNKTYAEYNIDSSSIVKNGWNLNRGFLNEDTQRIHDNDYYQYFSYSIKSKVQYEDWKDSVSSLNHTSGFKKFSDLIIEEENFAVGIATSQDEGDFVGISELTSVIDLECINDFDFVTENTFNISNNIISSEIVFTSKEIQDYFESVNNRVLIIDDISGQFNSNPRLTRYSVVDTFRLSDARYRKFFAYVRDKRYIEERQISIVSLLHDDTFGYINNYAAVSSRYDMGTFDFNISGTEGNLLFYPTNYSINDYDVSTISHNIKDSSVGVGTTSFGNSVYINTSQQIISSGLSTPQTVVSIGTTYRATKILLEISDGLSYHEVDEISVIHDGTNVNAVEYGQLTGGFGSYSSTGIGTYSASIVGSNININIHPYSTLTSEYTANAFQISAATGVGSSAVSTVELNSVEVGSAYTAISASGSPSQNIVFSTNTVDETQKHFDGVYLIASIEDTTNNQYEMCEIIILSDGSSSFITEYGNLTTGVGIGTFDSTISGGNLDLYFTPIQNADVTIRIFYNSLSEIDPSNLQEIIDLENGLIETSYGTYTGTERDIRRDFNLTHRGNEIFRRVVNGSDSNVVDVTNDTIKIPNHFYTTGEEIQYTIDTIQETSPIGIATTSIPGIGSTNLLPSSLYVVKIDESNIRVAASASESLSLVPNTLDLTSVGVGTQHIFTSKNQNNKVLISIDNMIQSPVTGSAITSKLLADFSFNSNVAYFTGITSFFGGDLIKIGDEIMKIESVGFGSELSVLVQRPWMGTGISSHSAGDLITRVSGNYNIVDNTLSFYEAPYGPHPLGSTTNPPDQRDYSGITTYSSFGGRVFLRSGIVNGTEESYQKNYIFDDISTEFNGITTQFTLKSNGNDVLGISTSNSIILVRDIFQGPQRVETSSGLYDIEGDYKLIEDSGSTIIGFTGYESSTSYDPNNSTIPVGGQIISVGSTFGFGYQPLVSAGGTAIVSISGTIQSISIGNSGSGYRSGIQTVNVGVATTSLGNYDIEFLGTAVISDGNITGVTITNPGSGYTYSSPPFVIFDSPLSYSNIPLTYSSSSPTGGIGTEAVVDIVVGQGSSVIDFKIKNLGYAYGQGDILTVDIGGLTGIPTDTSKVFSEFQINVEKTYTMEFSGWSIGDLQVIDEIRDQFDGEKRRFPLRIEGIRYSIVARDGSNIDLEANLLVFINDILQAPGESYIFNGGSTIEFAEAPKSGDTCKILFYKGTGDIDVVDVDILETVKIGDTLKINDYDNELFQQNPRVVTSINASDIAGTNPYAKPGVSRDDTYQRPVNWCKQRDDKIINKLEVGKDRVLYEPIINPTSYLIQSLSPNDTTIYVDNIAPFFNTFDENVLDSYRNSITILSQDSKVSASATALVSSAGIVTSIVISDGGVGYLTPPTVSISQPPYASATIYKPPGTADEIPYVEFGAGSMTQIYSGDIDDTFFTVNLPFTINFLGNEYDKVYVGTNGYITFGSGSSIYDNLSYNRPPLTKIHVYAGDRRVTKFYTQDLGSSLRMRVEGYNYGSSLSNTRYIYEVEINSLGYIDINYIEISQTATFQNTLISQGGTGNGVDPFISIWDVEGSRSYRVYTSITSVVGFNTATASASITSGKVTDIAITNSGIGYTTNPSPTVLIGPPKSQKEVDLVSSYKGDNGVIVGFGATTIGSDNKYIFDFYIPEDSYLRDSSIVSVASTLSSIEIGDYFVVRNSNVGLASTSQLSVRNDDSVIGLCTQFVDNVYQVSSREIATIDIIGVGYTNVVRVLTNISSTNPESFSSTTIKFDSTLFTFDSTGDSIVYPGMISTSRYFGEFSWGKIEVPTRTTDNNFNFYGSNGVTGLTTSAMVIRTNPLKYNNYL